MPAACERTSARCSSLAPPAGIAHHGQRAEAGRDPVGGLVGRGERLDHGGGAGHGRTGRLADRNPGVAPRDRDHIRRRQPIRRQLNDSSMRRRHPSATSPCARPGRTSSAPSGASAGRQQAEHVAAEAAADDPRAERPGVAQPRDRRLDRRRRDLVVVAQARVRGVEQRPSAATSPRVQRRDRCVHTRVLGDDVARARSSGAGSVAAISSVASRRLAMPSCAHARPHCARRSL